MTKFIDGPAAGVTLMLRRSPMFLRVTDNGKAFDALDQPADEPEPDERLYVYALTEYKGACHVNMGRGRGGFFTIADYTYLPEQPADAEIRDRAKWVAWTEANKHLIPEAIRNRK